MKFDASSLRKSADSPNFPYRERETTFLLISADGKVRSDHTIGGKVDILSDYKPGDLLVAAWNGQYRSDMFLLDFRKACAALDVTPARRAAAARTDKAKARKKPAGPTRVEHYTGELLPVVVGKILEHPCPYCSAPSGRMCSSGFFHMPRRRQATREIAGHLSVILAETGCAEVTSIAPELIVAVGSA